jgi:hypothetical protein
MSPYYVENIFGYPVLTQHNYGDTPVFRYSRSKKAAIVSYANEYIVAVWVIKKKQP